MEIPIEHEAFTGRSLAVRTAGLFKGPRLVIDHKEIKGKKQGYQVRDNSGKEVAIHLKINGIDPIPKVQVDGATIQLARPLTWYEYIWMGLPILLIFAGGALGALTGIAATYTSARIFRSDKSGFVKYLLSALISIAAVMAVLIAAVTIQILVEGV